MGYYIFESDTNNLSTNDVRQIVSGAGYDSSHFTYEQLETRKVKAAPSTKPADEMNINKLEKSAKENLGKTITVSYIA